MSKCGWMRLERLPQWNPMKSLVFARRSRRPGGQVEAAFSRDRRVLWIVNFSRFLCGFLILAAFPLVGGKMLAAALLQPFAGPEMSEMFLLVSNFSDSHADRVYEYQYTKYRRSNRNKQQGACRFRTSLSCIDLCQEWAMIVLQGCFCCCQHINLHEGDCQGKCWVMWGLKHQGKPQYRDSKEEIVSRHGMARIHDDVEESV